MVSHAQAVEDGATDPGPDYGPEWDADTFAIGRAIGAVEATLVCFDESDGVTTDDVVGGVFPIPERGLRDMEYVLGEWELGLRYLDREELEDKLGYPAESLRPGWVAVTVVKANADEGTTADE